MIRKYAEIFCWKNVSSFCSAKATHIFSAKNIRILCIESTKTVNEMTLNELVKLTTLWTTGPWSCVWMSNRVKPGHFFFPDHCLPFHFTLFANTCPPGEYDSKLLNEMLKRHVIRNPFSNFIIHLYHSLLSHSKRLKIMQTYFLSVSCSKERPRVI